MRYELKELETFLAVLDHGTVSAAAGRLNLAKSVVSKRIANLESALGAALFRRNAGRIVPTEAALALAERLRPALAELAAAAESAAWGMDGAAPLRGTLRIASPMSFGTLYLGPIIAGFASENPELDIIVDYDDRARDLPREGFDIGIRIGAARDGALKARKLCEDRMIACASPAYLDRNGAPRTPADLAGHEVIGYAHLPVAQLWQARLGQRVPMNQIRSRLSLNNGEAMRDLAEAGLGIAMLPGFIAAPALAAGRLVPVLDGYGKRDLPIAAVWPPVDPMPPKLRRFVDHLVRALEGGRPWRAET